MNSQLQQKLELFVSNTQSMKKNFIWQDTLTKQLAALLYAEKNKVVDCDAIHHCHELVKKNTGIFSAFRGHLAVSIAALLSLSENRDSLLSNMLAVYDSMTANRFRSSDYLAIAAYQIAAHTQPDQYPQTVKRAKAFYDGMKEKHWFYTGKDDYIFAAMLGLSDVDVNAGVERMEKLYNVLKPQFLIRNSLQALTQVLVLGGETEEAATRILSMRDAFRQRGLRLDKEYTLSSLGVLSLLPVNVDGIATDILEIHDFLRTQKGFGIWTVTKQQLLLFSSAMAAFSYIENIKGGLLTTVLSTSITNIMIAQQAAIAAVAASSAAAAAASSSNC